MTPVAAQDQPVRPEVSRESPPFPSGDDAATRGLRSLYVPGGLTSDETVRRTLATSPDLERTRALVAEAKGASLRAIGSLIPRLDLNASYTRFSRVFRPPQFPLFLDNFSTDATLGYSLTGSLAEALPSYRAAKKDKVASRHQIEAETNNVAFSAREAYYEFARSKAALGVALKTLEEATSQRQETESLVAAGAAPRVDAMRTQAQVSAAQVSVSQAELALAVARRTLQTLMHVDSVPTLGEDLSRPVVGVPTESQEALEQRALAERPDLKALRTAVQATEHQIRAARGGAAPDLLITGTAQYINPNPRVFPNEARFQATWDAGALVTWSPSDTFIAAGQAKQRKAELRRAVADIIALEDAIKVEVAEGYHGIFQAEAAWQSARIGLQAAAETYRIRRAQLRAGAVNTTDLLQAEAELTRARLDVVDSAIGLRTAKATLLRAIGVQP
ncbi:MAG: TolC family protein [Myxococcota bacterium]